MSLNFKNNHIDLSLSKNDPMNDFYARYKDKISKISKDGVNGLLKCKNNPVLPRIYEEFDNYKKRQLNSDSSLDKYANNLFSNYNNMNENYSEVKNGTLSSLGTSSTGISHFIRNTPVTKNVEEICSNANHRDQSGIDGVILNQKISSKNQILNNSKTKKQIKKTDVSQGYLYNPNRSISKYTNDILSKSVNLIPKKSIISKQISEKLPIIESFTNNKSIVNTGNSSTNYLPQLPNNDKLKFDFSTIKSKDFQYFYNRSIDELSSKSNYYPYAKTEVRYIY